MKPELKEVLNSEWRVMLSKESCLKMIDSIGTMNKGLPINNWQDLRELKEGVKKCQI